MKNGGESGVWNRVTGRGDSICKDPEAGRSVFPQLFLFHCVSASIQHATFARVCGVCPGGGGGLHSHVFN